MCAIFLEHVFIYETSFVGFIPRMQKNNGNIYVSFNVILVYANTR